MLDQPYMFDFYQGGGLNQTVLGMAQVDAEGNLNVSRFGPRLAGCGGFIDIAQNTKKVNFVGTMTAGGLEIAVENDRLKIVQEGAVKKFIKKVEQITFGAKYAKMTGQKVTYITERCVFELSQEGLVLTEMAEGLDLQKDILDQMEFMPILPKEIKPMDVRLFAKGPMYLAKTDG
jgi:propionate CoA-transferase